MTAHYTYDALGRRIEKAVSNGTTTVTQYVYDHEDILLKRDGVHTMTARYTHGPGIDEPLLLAQDGQWSVYHADGLGSITALTDAAGVLQQHYTYTAFGTIASPLDAGFVQPYTFTAREFNAETGLYYTCGRARMMPRQGAFSSTTPSALPRGTSPCMALVERGQRLTLRESQAMKLLLECGYAVSLEALQPAHA